MNFLRLVSLAGLAVAIAAPLKYGFPVIRYTQGYPLPRRRNTGAAAVRRQARKTRNRRRARRA